MSTDWLVVQGVDMVSEEKEELDRLDTLLFSGEELYPKVHKDVHWWYLRDLQRPGAPKVGFGGVCVYDNGETGFLCRSGVLPQYRGQGLQRRLIQVRERWMRKRGIDTSISYTLTSNLQSNNNLIRSGYRLYRPNWEFKEEHWLYWYKEL